MYTPLIPLLLIGIGLDWIWLMIIARRIFTFVSWLGMLLIGRYHTFTQNSQLGLDGLN
jgi:hypothetical protein